MHAKEARYHETCRHDYVRHGNRPHHHSNANAIVTNDQKTNAPGVDTVTEARAAFSNAFETVCTCVAQEVIQCGKVVLVHMTMSYYTETENQVTDTFW